MRRLNNKGFAISGVVYSLLLLFVILLYAVLAILANRKIILDKTKKDLLLEINGESETGESASGPSVADYTFANLIAQFDGTQSFKAGKWADLTGLGNDGTISGFDEGGGKKTNYIYFDGKQDYIEFPRVISGNFTIEVVFSTTKGVGTSDEWDTGAGLVDASVSGIQYDYGLSINKNGSLLAGTGKLTTTANAKVSSRKGFNNGNIQTVTFIRDMSSSKILLYTNGSKEKEGTGSTTSLTAPTKITIGKIQSAAKASKYYFDGKIYSVRIYNKILTPTEIQNNYKVDKARYFLPDPPSPAPLT